MCVQGQLCNRSMVYPALSLQRQCMANMEMPLLTATEQAVPDPLPPPDKHHPRLPPAPSVCLGRGLSNVITAGGTIQTHTSTQASLFVADADT